VVDSDVMAEILRPFAVSPVALDGAFGLVPADGKFRLGDVTNSVFHVRLL
jgi:hypothetical protein